VILDESSDRLFPDDASDGPTSDSASSCSNDDSSVGDASELSDIDDNDYDLNDLGEVGDEFLVDFFAQQTSVPEQRNNIPIDKEDSTVHASPILLASTNEAVGHLNQNQPTMSGQSQPTTPSTSSSLSHPFGFVLVGDNIDKNIRPSYQRQDRSTQSLHYFHSYAALNRINISGLSDSRPSPTTISPDKILPDNSERQRLLGDFETLIARYLFLHCTLRLIMFSTLRVLVQNMEEFKTQQHEVQWHIKSDYCMEMASKSKVVRMCHRAFLIILASLTLLFALHLQC